MSVLSSTSDTPAYFTLALACLQKICLTKSLEELEIIVEVLEEDLRAINTHHSLSQTLSSNPPVSPAQSPAGNSRRPDQHLYNMSLKNILTATTSTTPHMQCLLSNIQGTTVTSLMKWSPAHSPTCRTHWAEWSTTRPRRLSASCTPAFSLPALQLWKETAEEGRSGLIPRTPTGTWTALRSSGPSCRKKRTSWGTSLMQHYCPPMNMAERKFGASQGILLFYENTI